MAARQQRYEVPTDTSEQRLCARGAWCAASARDTEGAWHPARSYQPFCHACESQIVTSLTEIPKLYALLTAGPAGLSRKAGRMSRSRPGPRIHIATGADALARECSALLAGWAARVRAVPTLRLSPPEHPLGEPRRVREDCKDMALHPGPLLALADAWTSRIYDLPDAGRAHLLDRASAACRKCGRTVTRSRASGWWWAPDGRPSAFCDHDPGPVTSPPARGPVPDDIEADIGDEEIIHAGDGWVKVLRERSGRHAGEEILDLRWQARRLTGQAPAGPDRLEGVPCRSCEDMALARAELPAAPEDPGRPPPFSRCLSCRADLTRAEYDAWAAMYAAWAKGAGILTCRRCDLGICARTPCCWGACTCRKPGHRSTPAR
jgi:hypothetical protein